MVSSSSPGGRSGRVTLPPRSTVRVAPFSTPAGMVTSMVRTRLPTRPAPRQVLQGSTTMRPVPWQLRARPLDGDGQHPLLEAHPPPPAARRARRRRGAGRRARAGAALAGLDALVLDLLGAAERRLLEGDADLLLQDPAVAHLDAERAQQVPEEAVDVEVGHVERHAPEGVARLPGAAAGAPERRLAVAIERGPLLRIAEDLVRRVDLFEAGVRAVVARVLVRVMERGLAAKRALDLVLRRRPVHAEDVVRVPHAVGDSTRAPAPHPLTPRSTAGAMCAAMTEGGLGGPRRSSPFTEPVDAAPGGLGSRAASRPCGARAHAGAKTVVCASIAAHCSAPGGPKATRRASASARGPSPQQSRVRARRLACEPPASPPGTPPRVRSQLSAPLRSCSGGVGGTNLRLSRPTRRPCCKAAQILGHLPASGPLRRRAGSPDGEQARPTASLPEAVQRAGSPYGDPGRHSATLVGVRRPWWAFCEPGGRSASLVGVLRACSAFCERARRSASLVGVLRACSAFEREFAKIGRAARNRASRLARRQAGSALSEHGRRSPSLVARFQAWSPDSEPGRPIPSPVARFRAWSPDSEPGRRRASVLRNGCIYTGIRGATAARPSASGRCPCRAAPARSPGPPSCRRPSGSGPPRGR